MRLLLDTHTALWLREGDDRLGQNARELLEDPAESGAIELPVTIEHAEASARLPWHHRDPFDRLLIAQANLEEATLLTADPRMRAYDVKVTW